MSTLPGCVPRSASAAAAVGPGRRRPAGRAGADGRHHQHRVPPAVPRGDGDRAGARGGRRLFVSEMITSRALVERNPKTLRLIRFEADEQPRSMQLYGVDPAVVGAAVRMIVERGPGRPRRPQLRLPGPQGHPQGRRLGAAVAHRAVRRHRHARRCAPPTARVPVTVKMRIGIDAEHLTYREAGLRAQDAGVAARRPARPHRGAVLRRHGRLGRRSPSWPTCSTSRCSATATSGRPTTRCGWSRETGCAGVVVGRGCLGRPWLFADLAAAFAGRPERARPGLAEVAATMRRHAELLADWLGDERGVRRLPQARRLVPQGLRGRQRAAVGAGQASSLAELDDLLGPARPDQPFPDDVLGQPARAHHRRARRRRCRDGWLADRRVRAVPSGAELDRRRRLSRARQL